MRILIILMLFVISCGNSVTGLKEQDSVDGNIPDNDSTERELWTDSDDGSEFAIWLDGNFHDRGFSVAVDNEGNYYVAGLMYFNRYFGKLFLSKFNSDRSLAWSKVFEDEGNVSNPSMTLNDEGVVFVAGSTNEDFDGNKNAGLSDIFLAAFDENGSKLWTKLYGTDKSDRANSINVDKKGDIYICGTTDGGFGDKENAVSDCTIGEDANCEDILILKVDSSGEMLNVEQWGTEENDAAKDMAFDDEGNLFVVGYTRSALDENVYGGGNCDDFPCADIFISKFNPELEKFWTKQFGYDAEDFAQSIVIDSKGNLVVGGSKLIKMSSEAVEIWSKPFVDSVAVVDSSDNIFTLGGDEADSRKVLMKIEPDGNVLWNRELNTLYSDDFYGEMIMDNMDSLILTGSIQNDYWNGGPKIPQDDAFLKIWDKGNLE